MGMDSYLELFTTAYGWTLANLIYGLLVDTGLVFLPLVATVISVWSQAFTDGTENGGPDWAIRKLEIEFYCGLFVMALAFVPSGLSRLDRARLTYTPDATLANPTPAQVTGTATGTTYDTALGPSAGAVDVPLWWYTVMSVSSGFTNGVRAGTTNQYLGIRQAEQMAQLATIPDPALRAEAQRFASECWTVARGMYFSGQQPVAATTTATNANEIYGLNNTEWIGSKVFIDDAAYYAEIRARSPVPGFPIDIANDDKDAPPGSTGDSRPNCKRWWTDTTVGLRERLLSAGPDKVANNAWGILQAWDNRGGAMTEDNVKDATLRQALWNTHSNFAETGHLLGQENESRWSIPGFFSKLGIFSESPKASFSYDAIVQFILMVQPLVLMSIYIFMPLVVVMSRFSIAFMVYGAIAIFTVKFWSAMWAIARLIDERMVSAMYGSDTMLIREFLTNGIDGGAKRAVLNALTLALFIALPLVWSGMMTWVGFNVGSAVNAMLAGAVKSGQKAGEKGLTIAKDTATNGAEVVGKIATRR